MAPIVCPRCGYEDTFIEGFLPETCTCRMCQSQLDWREIPGMGPGCQPLPEQAGSAEPTTMSASEATPPFAASPEDPASTEVPPPAGPGTGE